MERRDALRALGAAAAFTLLPHTARAAWSAVAAAPGAPPRALRDDRAALIGGLADAIIPRTDTPSATDVNVGAFIDVIVAEYYSDEERTAFLAGLDAIGARITSVGDASFAVMSPDAKRLLLDELDKPADRQAPEARAWSRLKGLVVHGYFTSEQVQKDVLKTVIMPGRFDGNAPMKVAGNANG
ncbi:MAG TPA: gluconate 2-dehydrogenase subunit 3 family protein [Vicinamibacterales bacterium]